MTRSKMRTMPMHCSTRAVATAPRIIGSDDEEIGPPGRDAVDLARPSRFPASTPRRPASRIAMVTPAPCQMPAMMRPIDRRVAVAERREVKLGPAPAAHGGLQAEVGVEDPLPDEAGHDRATWRRDRGRSCGTGSSCRMRWSMNTASRKPNDEVDDQRQEAEEPDVLDRRQPAASVVHSRVVLVAARRS